MMQRSRLRPLALVLNTPKAAVASSRRENDAAVAAAAA